MTAQRKSLRGTKRRCQSESCGLPFYDLNRPQIACPACATAYVIALPKPSRASSGRWPQPYRRHSEPVPVDAADVEAADKEAADQQPAEADEGEPILDVDEEGEAVLPEEVEPEAPAPE